MTVSNQVNLATRMVIRFPTQNHEYHQHPSPTYAPQTTGHLSKILLHLSLLNSSTKTIRRQQLKSTRFCTLCQIYWQFMTTNLLFSITRMYTTPLMPYLLAACHGNPRLSHTRVPSQVQMFRNGWKPNTLSGSVTHINSSWRCLRTRTLQYHLTTHLTDSMMKMATASMKISCQGIGHGSKLSVFVGS
jgi:hypothetical protein